MAGAGKPLIRAIAVYCASTDRLPQATCDLARDLGQALAARGIRLVYGGGARGLMGIIARSAHAAGGEVQGFMLNALRGREGANTAFGRLEFVETLDERKQCMAAAADAVIALPGGIGTLDELTQILTLDDIGLAAKPVCLCDVDGFWEPFMSMLSRFHEYGVIRPSLRRDLLRADGAAQAIDLCVQALAARAAKAA